MADFGLAGLLGKGEVLDDGRMVGNPRFWAPEIVDRQPWSKATDVYAWAITTVTFVTRRNVFMEYWTGTALRLDFLEAILEGVRPTLPGSPFKCPAALKSLLELSWSHDPAKRPSFPEIVVSFEREVLLQCATFNPVFRDVWVKHVCKKSVEPGLVREVSWSMIEDMLFSRNFEDFRNTFDHPALSRTRLLVYKLFRNDWSPFGEEIVTLEHFGRVVGFFPPMVNLGDGKWVSVVTEMCSHRWFWGDSSRIEVEHYLRGSATGTFVVRFANQASFRLSVQTDENTTRHFFVRHSYSSPVYGVKGVEGLEKKEFDNLRTLAEAVAQKIGVALVEPTRSPFF